jgi:hypothetical protein
MEMALITLTASKQLGNDSVQSGPSSQGEKKKSNEVGIHEKVC